jgi:hypothetical protein
MEAYSMPDLFKNTETALEVLRNPAAFHDQPAILATSWATLLAERGQTMHLDRIGPPAHQVIPDIIETRPTQAERIRSKVHAHAERRGYVLPPQDGVPA